ncbi:hypothetical protein G6698_06525 [Polynucleobacter paneuropaeus]|nr:hypothetical protein [Polynucleobacter paneuropaeus]MBT8577343.1 hypothetical protein [Polynucleobacter paneuropaeus]
MMFKRGLLSANFNQFKGEKMLTPNIDLLISNGLYKKAKSARFQAQCDALKTKLYLMFEEAHRVSVEQHASARREVAMAAAYLEAHKKDGYED